MNTEKIPLTARSVIRSFGLYPISTLWLVGALIGGLLVAGELTWPASLIIFTLVALFVLVWATWKELKAVHKLVDGQRSDMLVRIDQLADLLVASGVTVPQAEDSEGHARRDVSPTARTDAWTTQRHDEARRNEGLTE